MLSFPKTNFNAVSFVNWYESLFCCCKWRFLSVQKKFFFCVLNKPLWLYWKFLSKLLKNKKYVNSKSDNMCFQWFFSFLFWVKRVVSQVAIWYASFFVTKISFFPRKAYYVKSETFFRKLKTCQSQNNSRCFLLEFFGEIIFSYLFELQMLSVGLPFDTKVFCKRIYMPQLWKKKLYFQNVFVLNEAFVST